MSDLEQPLQKLRIDVSAFPKLSAEEAALASQWTTLALRLPENLAKLNEFLKTRTYIVGNSPSEADVDVFSQTESMLRSWSSIEDLSRYRHIIRWADLVQHTLLEPKTPFTVNYSAEVPREIKAKPEKKKEQPKGDAELQKPQKSKAQDKPEGKPTGPPQDEAARKAAKEAKEAKKAAKAKARAELEAKANASQVPPNPSMVDFRVGFIQKAVKHPDADSLYVSTIDMGDPEGPRTVCSGLVKYVPIEDMQQRYVVVIANLKPVNMRGIKSSAMVLCASKKEIDRVEFVNPPEGAAAGDKIFFEGFDGTPEKQLNPKKKIFETVQPRFTTNEAFEVLYQEEGKPAAKLVHSSGALCHASTLVGAQVS
ncbi:tRNA and methionyl-and glutamyl-tRNA synthetases binding protein [Komagataella phaffii CBS 7435]|uniref:Protein that binds tRNA and methionyl-and glutamyl-tRNA synthetases (Mes1p and Gus1p) n=2 Tax=Komagataella phaffii TaxID=460519 RepID=C4R1K7_KOMPG|nr:Protein that binds tRNA and methionyl-and glutamyl-tRNA synthetases (Mes1p and Gus1p) [Komagataella phaffii GS115]AOA62484.1 GQ67_00798T0 [Komagataella phaffii]CAH2448087.1 tRNA and methionyl-and glutamyl-tRNA synthetases binding protein [Komagataella phaffii CBS 7435]AOA66997.1 GQ68_00591T0 [Komagataella phaffii GS115]CAY69381.1 Protein that binds tRNA and methionyl-and glutamyl-tRNA synthetases (Mes1p and Gus1p) [Komagataella phaffii GS115]CCA38232.1 tRNA and methionyl-and glutamyl-tRNA s